jgi:hypothetical protein
MNYLKPIINDLREKRLWPIAALLLVALIAVPVLLSSGGGGGTPVAQLSTNSELPAPAGVPVVSSSAAPSQGKLTGKSRNPFTQLEKSTNGTTGASGSKTAGTGSSSGAGTSTTGTSTTSSGTSSTASTGTSSSTSTTTTTTTTIPTGTPKPAPTGLTDTQSYSVTLAITNSYGGLDTYSPLERLSALPSDDQPLVVELGVLKGGNRVLFLVRGGTVVSGPGQCIPGPVDCQILALAQDQTEGLSVKSGTGTKQVALFAVTAITAAGHSSVAAANKARNAVSAAGRRLVNDSDASVLPLFQYDPSVGAVLDLRNLTVGGN